MVHSIQEVIDAELNARQQLSEQILEIIQARCINGAGRVQRGALHLYVYNKLGFHGSPGNKFARFINKIMVNAGYRDSYLVGKRCYYGLSFKGESKENWNNPTGEDIPVWSSNLEKFVFRPQSV